MPESDWGELYARFFTDTTSVLVPEPDWGELYIYGIRLEPPFTFSGVGTDTLRVNGVVLFPPLRRTQPSVPDWRDELLQSATHAYWDHGGGLSGLQAAREAYSSDSRVDSVLVEADGATLAIYVHGATRPFRQMLDSGTQRDPRVPPSQAEVDRAAAARRSSQQSLVRSVAWTLSNHGIFAVGTGYTFGLSAADAATLRPLLDDPSMVPDHVPVPGMARFLDDVRAARESGDAVVR